MLKRKKIFVIAVLVIVMSVAMATTAFALTSKSVTWNLTDEGLSYKFSSTVNSYGGHCAGQHYSDSEVKAYIRLLKDGADVQYPPAGFNPGTMALIDGGTDPRQKHDWKTGIMSEYGMPGCHAISRVYDIAGD